MFEERYRFFRAVGKRSNEILASGGPDNLILVGCAGRGEQQRDSRSSSLFVREAKGSRECFICSQIEIPFLVP